MTPGRESVSGSQELARGAGKERGRGRKNRILAEMLTREISNPRPNWPSAPHCFPPGRLRGRRDEVHWDFPPPQPSSF